MKFFAHQAINGEWHTVYTRHDDGDMISCNSGCDEQTHANEARRMQAIHDKAVAQSIAFSKVDRMDRPLAKGFYDDNDAR